MPQCYPGEQCASGGQKTHPGSSGCPWLPRGHNAVPQWERLHLFHRHVSHDCAAVNCSVGSFSGNSKPREPSLKSSHDPNLARFPGSKQAAVGLLTHGIDPDGYHDCHNAIARCHWFTLITTASPPRLSISPSRLALRRIITPCSFCNHRSPALVVPRAKP